MKQSMHAHTKNNTKHAPSNTDRKI